MKKQKPCEDLVIEERVCDDCLRNPKPLYDHIDHSDVVKSLLPYEENVINVMNPKLRDSGLISKDGLISAFEDGWTSGFMSAIAMGDPDIDEGNFAGCTIANTFNRGFRYVGVDDSNNTVDLGPVITACIVGNVRRPQGVYIPMNNPQAIRNGVSFALGMLETLEDNAAKRIQEDSDSIKW